MVGHHSRDFLCVLFELLTPVRPKPGLVVDVDHLFENETPLVYASHHDADEPVDPFHRFLPSLGHRLVLVDSNPEDIGGSESY